MPRYSDAKISLRRIDAVVFDMDGVVTDTAATHAAAWKQLFDGYFRERSDRSGETFEPFGERDYLLHVDGKPRQDGVRDFLASRGIRLPEGEPSDPADAETVHGLGNRKNRAFADALAAEGARAFASSVDLIRALRSRGVRTAVISASRNASEVLAAAGVGDLFEVRVDGEVAAARGLKGKPDPAVFLEAARELGVEPARAAVIEDSLAGVRAGRSGDFGLVVGVDRGAQSEALAAAGADVVVGDLAELRIEEARRISDVPSALASADRIAAALSGKRTAVFLDYDGTLTPIVGHPDDAVLPDGTRKAIERLAAATPVAIVSGRDLEDVRTMTGIDSVFYAGSHGFDIAGPGGLRSVRGEEFDGSLTSAANELAAAVTGTPGAWVERKRFAVALHTRQADRAHLADLEAAAARVAAGHPDLRLTGGKEIHEMRPALEWDKGKALLWLLELLGLDGDDVAALYVGDDETDEDAFAAVAGRGIAVVVRGENDRRDTLADYSVEDTDEARILLERLASAIENPS